MKITLFVTEYFLSPAWGEMCITGGVAIAQPPEVRTTHSIKPRRGEIIKCGIVSGCNWRRQQVPHLAPAGLFELGSYLSGGCAALHRRLCTSRP
ncbi:MAG: hypothetical protein LBK06_01720 [Planctomycetaceae bacterium]|nr:hypothetical protein [Planctomycetaceae bacterium]